MKTDSGQFALRISQCQNVHFAMAKRGKFAKFFEIRAVKKVNNSRVAKKPNVISIIATIK